uniref:Nucleolar protein 56 n=1 Tax=Heterorhabditis bacteriophora TaxID=37862 RepID=A0A1I7XMN9_HETBA
MAEVPHYILYEHAVGFALLKVKEFEDAALIIPEVDASIADVQKFNGIVKLVAFDPFKNTEAALENCNALSEGIIFLTKQVCIISEYFFLEIVDDDEEKAAEIIESARTSMGMDISDMDLANIERFASRVASLAEYRQHLHEYIKDRMSSCAPSLSALIGEQVGARLISHAGSLTNLAKYPSSTVQILGAEKALFRALKTRSATPKYGLLFHSSFIGRASAKNKGRISRFLANKCTIASRIDCFSEVRRLFKLFCIFYNLKFEVPVSTFGEFLREQVEERLKYFETGELPQKNLDVMVKAQEEAKDVQGKVLKKRKKAAKKARKIMEDLANTTVEEPVIVTETDKKKKKRSIEAEVEEEKPKKKKKAKKEVE